MQAPHVPQCLEFMLLVGQRCLPVGSNRDPVDLPFTQLSADLPALHRLVVTWLSSENGWASHTSPEWIEEPTCLQQFLHARVCLLVSKLGCGCRLYFTPSVLNFAVLTAFLVQVSIVSSNGCCYTLLQMPPISVEGTVLNHLTGWCINTEWKIRHERLWP